MQATRPRLNLVFMHLTRRQVANHSSTAQDGPCGVALPKGAFNNERDVGLRMRVLGEHGSAGINVFSKTKWPDITQA